VEWKHPIVVDNRAGAGGTVGSDIVAKASPDGHTLLLGNVSTLAITPHLYRNLPYDPLRDFAPITLITTSTNVLVIHPSVPARSIKEFIALAKANPRGFSYGSTGSGTTPHLAGEMFKTMAGIEMVHVPYKGSAPALADLLGGQVQVMFGTLATSTPLIRSGKLRALGVTSLKLPGFEVMIWQAMVAPSRTPKSVVARLNADIVKSLHAAEMRTRLTSQGLEAVGNSPEEFSAYIRAEYAKWGKVVKASGATLD
jgi:tripartite-type tricarboxylate transporter receptor subunit TctC